MDKKDYRLAHTLKRLRTSKGLTIDELVKKANIGNGTVGDIERGQSNGTVKTLEKISAALSLTPAERKELYQSFIPEDVTLRDNIHKQDVTLRERAEKQNAVLKNYIDKPFGFTPREQIQTELIGCMQNGLDVQAETLCWAIGMEREGNGKIKSIKDIKNKIACLQYVLRVLEK